MAGVVGGVVYRFQLVDALGVYTVLSILRTSEALSAAGVAALEIPLFRVVFTIYGFASGHSVSRPSAAWPP